MTTIADYLFQQLQKLGITDIFGVPGDYSFPLLDAIEANSDLNWIGCTNELNAGYAADGYARTKGYGAIVTTYGVGELSAINAIAGAMAENAAVIKIVGVPATKDINSNKRLHHNLSDVDYKTFYRCYANVTLAYCFLDETYSSEQAKKEIDNLINLMVKYKKPVYFAIPIDVAKLEINHENTEIIEPKSDNIILNKVVDEIINTIEKSSKPILIADILTKRFGAKEKLNEFLDKTEIASTCFMRGLDVIKSSTKNYLGPYADKFDNNICFEYLNASDCIILSGSVLSDLNSFNFENKFKPTIEINPHSVKIKDKIFENVLIKDVYEKLSDKIQYKSNEIIRRTFKYDHPIVSKPNLTCDYIYSKIGNFLQDGDNLVVDIGTIPYGIMPLNFPDSIVIQNQCLWGSIGWATAATLGVCMANQSRRTILITGDGSFQMTSSEISTMTRNNLKPVIFLINNQGYTIERLLCDNPESSYNNIASWNYLKFPEVFGANCYIAGAKTEDEFDEILKEIQKQDKMCFIELKIPYMNIPKFAINVAKHPELI